MYTWNYLVFLLLGRKILASLEIVFGIALSVASLLLSIAVLKVIILRTCSQLHAGTELTQSVHIYR